MEVQFETLRWISDARLTVYLAQVEQLLQRSEISYRLFEAAVATWNILSGQPEEGVRNVKMLMEGGFTTVLAIRACARLLCVCFHNSRIMLKRSRSSPLG